MIIQQCMYCVKAFLFVMFPPNLITNLAAYTVLTVAWKKLALFLNFSVHVKIHFWAHWFIGYDSLLS